MIIQFNTETESGGYINQYGKWIDVPITQDLKTNFQSIEKEYLKVKSEEEILIDKAQKEAEETKEKLKEAQNKIASLLTGNKDEVMTEEMAKQYPELTDGISIDAGDYYREKGKTILYRAKKDMVYNANTMSPTGDNGKMYWQGMIEEKPTNNSQYKYPKGTEKEYMGVYYYACSDTNDGPEVGYPTWDLLENKDN